ncbi:MAG: MBL fold metallo-hydrolase [Blastocatellia bacterium]|nr:MBL fold metallo-hydrolase [Blastocatellia bacterium]
MTGDKVFFKQNVLAEPLFNQWYAWPYLIPPASAAMYIANSHLKIMRSFVSAPQLHISALKNPTMIGGPFINYDASKTDAIKHLIDKTVTEQKIMLEFAEAIEALDQMLLDEANGYSMEAHYSKVPDILRGYVELVYDLHDNPTIRFLEGLLYKSRFYNVASQSIALSEINSDSRSFVFSTPRLGSDKCLFLNLPFGSEALDELFKMKTSPRHLEYIRDALSIENESNYLFATFFTEHLPERPRNFSDDGVRIRYFGHACILIETKNVSLLIDPVISYKYNDGIGRETFADLPETIDYALITHSHQDHMMFETLLQLRHKVRSIIVPRSSGGDRVDPSAKLILQSVGFRNVWELDELERVEIPGGYVMGCPFLGEHADLNVRSKLSYYFSLHGKSILAVADSNNLESRLYQHLHEIVGDVDVLFIGMECDGAPLSWLYGPLFTKPISRKNDQSRRFDGSTCDKGIAIIDALKSKQIYVYAMGQEPWCSFLTSIRYTEDSRPIIESNKLVKECLARGMTAERLYGCKNILL